MKPIFAEEKQFLEKQLGFELPDQCWRNSNEIYLNGDKETRILTFNVIGGKIKIRKNTIDQVLAKFENKSWQQEIEENRDRLEMLTKQSIEETVNFLEIHKDCEIRVSHSGGKDSDIALYMFLQAMEQLGRDDYQIDFHNSTNETAQTYLHIKEDLPFGKLNIHNPEKGWYQWIKEDKNYYLPSVLYRNCCDKYKEGSIRKVLDKNKNYVLILGMRKHESKSRSGYSFDLNKAMIEQGKKLNMPLNWQRFLPVVEWTDKDVWLFILDKEIKVNKQYHFGFNRCGCLICPYGSDYVDLLIQEFYPLYWERWRDIVYKNYEQWGVEKRLKWSREEYFEEGWWKDGYSKEQVILGRVKTNDRVLELAELKGISPTMAAKYWNRKCSCDKKLNPDEIGMYLKVMGRYEQSEEDNRTYLCKKCLSKQMGWTTTEYTEKTMEFRNGGCNLF